MALAPGLSLPAAVMTFRCPTEQERWVRSFVKKGVNLSQALAWAVELGQEYYEAMAAFSDQIEAAAKAEKITRGEMVGRLIEAGLATLDRDRKARR